MGDDRVWIRLAALAAGMAAKAGKIDPADVAKLSDQASRDLAAGDALRISIEDFVKAYAAQRRDALAVAELGETLRRAVELDAYTPAETFRRDIHG